MAPARHASVLLAVCACVSTEDVILEPNLAAHPSAGRASKSEESAGWEPVRDSWVEAPAAMDAPRSEPPPLPASVRELPARRSPSDEALADRMLERLAAGDYEASLMAAEALLRRLPRDADALDCAEMSRTELRELYSARLGGVLHRVPVIASRGAIAALTLDVITAFLLARIEGVSTLHEIAFAPGMSPERALRVLSELYLKGVIALHP
jgi:hypothetical protein